MLRSIYNPVVTPPEWRREWLRTYLWLVPSIEVVGGVALFLVTLPLDPAAFHGQLSCPSWVISGSADAARQILTTIAAAVITVVGVVFSITIVALTLASTQFGPRMLRNFIRDRGTQLTLGHVRRHLRLRDARRWSRSARGRTATSCRTCRSPCRWR